MILSLKSNVCPTLSFTNSHRLLRLVCGPMKSVKTIFQHIVQKVFQQLQSEWGRDEVVEISCYAVTRTKYSDFSNQYSISEKFKILIFILHTITPAYDDHHGKKN